jgi:hypothetical protein
MIQLLATLALLAAAEVSADTSAHHPAHAPSGTAQALASPYAGDQARAIKALSGPEQRAWLEGQGMGLAKAAELNGYPGPMHVLEHAAALGLSAPQQQQSRELMIRHKAEVRALGAEVVEAERVLDALFRARRAMPAEVSRQSQQIASLQARIRAAHLNTHLEQSALLRPEQIAAYDRLRGYRP